jgi:hypothetical protein
VLPKICKIYEFCAIYPPGNHVVLGTLYSLSTNYNYISILLFYHVILTQSRCALHITCFINSHIPSYETKPHQQFFFSLKMFFLYLLHIHIFMVFCKVPLRDHYYFLLVRPNSKRQKQIRSIIAPFSATL